MAIQGKDDFNNLLRFYVSATSYHLEHETYAITKVFKDEELENAYTTDKLSTAFLETREKAKQATEKAEEKQTTDLAMMVYHNRYINGSSIWHLSREYF